MNLTPLLNGKLFNYTEYFLVNMNYRDQLMLSNYGAGEDSFEQQGDQTSQS